MDDMRKAFEAWVVETHRLWTDKYPNGSYMDVRIGYMWDTWQAATMAERERCAKVCDDADKSTHPADMADAIRGE